jgi:hypothetical protein
MNPHQPSSSRTGDVGALALGAVATHLYEPRTVHAGPAAAAIAAEVEEQPRARRRALSAQMPGRAAPVGLVDGDVQPGIADGVARRREPARITRARRGS